MSTLKSPFSLVFGMLAVAGVLNRTPARAETIPEVSANRVIELAPPESQEKTPVISSVALDPAGKRLAAVGDDHLVRIFDAQTGGLVQRLKWHYRLGQGLGIPAGRPGAGHGGGRRANTSLGLRQPRTGRETCPSGCRRSTHWPTARTGEHWRRRVLPTRSGFSTASKAGRSANWPRRAATSAPSPSRPTARG